MEPLKFTLANALELIPDARRRQIGEDARRHAEARTLPPADDAAPGATYWDGVLKAHEELVWLDAYNRRVARLKRMDEKKNSV